jgi:hypothetical protein
MCPLLRIANSSAITRREADYSFRTWLRNARCVTTLYFRRGDEQFIECPECKSAKPAAEKENYCGITTHHIHFGGVYNPQRCDLCHKPVASRCDPRDCRQCSLVVEDFVHHLIREGDSP